MIQLTPLEVHVFSIDGSYGFRLPYTAATWTHTLNQPGSAQVTINYSRDAVKLNLGDELRPWKCLIALMRGRDVIHAGPLTDVDWKASDRTLDLTVGGGWTCFTKILVIDSKLSGFGQQRVTIDEKHPAGVMAMTFRGSYGDIVRGLVMEALKWQAWPIDAPKFENGTKTRTYYAWDLATVADRISDITQLETGTEVRFDPYLADNGQLRWKCRCGNPEIVDTSHIWNTTAPDGRAIFDSVSGKGTDMTTQVWGTAGKDSDKTLMAKKTNTAMINKGWPLMQSTNTSHTTVSDMSTLAAHIAAQLNTNSWPDETYTLRVGAEQTVQPGDWAAVRVDDDYLGNRRLVLKVTDVSGSADSDWLTVTCRSRELR